MRWRKKPCETSARGGAAICEAPRGFRSGDTTNRNRSPGDVGDSDRSHAFATAHITPEAQQGGNIALIKNGDPIMIDAVKRKITLAVAEGEIEARRAKWKAPKARYTTGVLARYSKLMSSASEGAVTNKGLGL